MDDRWIDEREGRGRGWRNEGYGRGEARPTEARSFSEDRFGARRSGPDRDRVFGERDSGAEYNRSSVTRGSGHGGARFDGETQDYTRGGHFYGDDARTPHYRSPFGEGGQQRGRVPESYDAGRPEARDHRGGWQDRHYSGPSPAFYRGPPESDQAYVGRGERFEARAYQAGQGLRRVGERISNFMGSFERPDHDDEPRRIATDFGPREHWADHRGRGPKNYKRSDERIHDDVCQRLTDDPWLDASEVEVGVSAGEVTLTGSVESREAKRRAEDLAEDLAGVTNVKNDLRVGAARSV